MAITLLRLTETKASVKVTASGTLSLSTSDAAAKGSNAANGGLLSSTQVVSGTPAATIIAAHWTGSADGVCTIARGSTTILTLTGAAAAQMFFQDQDLVDNINSTSDLVFTITNTMQVYLVLRKSAGYVSKIEPEVFGSLDDPTVVGS